MLLRISLIVAILAGLATGTLTFIKVQDIIVTTRAARDEWNGKYHTEYTAHVATKNTLKKTQTDLATTKQNLAETKTALEAANGKVEELGKANAELSTTLEKTRGERDTAQQELEQWHLIPGGLKPGQIKDLIAELENTKKARDAVGAENKIIAAARDELQYRWDTIFGTNNGPVILPTGLRGKVLVVDPKYDFVVLNIGRDQGAKERGEMMVSRGGKLIGKVQIASVQKDRCVANILPNWKPADPRLQVMEEDEVLY